MRQAEQQQFADTICEILHKVYIVGRERFNEMAREADVQVESLAAAAVSQFIFENYTINPKRK
jgi:hypothetical protein